MLIVLVLSLFNIDVEFYKIWTCLHFQYVIKVNSIRTSISQIDPTFKCRSVFLMNATQVPLVRDCERLTIKVWRMENYFLFEVPVSINDVVSYHLNQTSCKNK